MKLSELTKQRAALVKLFEVNKFYPLEIIANLYSQKAHFVYELLQNADDAKASEVTFNLDSKSLTFQHNGEKLFDIEDVEAITTIGSSMKKDDVNKIGTFGAGFKSVFAVTKTPAIYSKNFNFRIVDFIVPKEISPKNDDKECTVIYIPFDHRDMSKEIAYQEIDNAIQSLKFESLLFLNNIKKIEWSTPADSGRYCLFEETENKVKLEIKFNEETEEEIYLLFRQPITFKTDLSLAVAYKIDVGSNAVEPAGKSKIFVFFPTKESTGLKFLVHAPYKTTPSRETIPLVDDEENQKITDELTDLIADSIERVKKEGFLNVDFFSLLPIDPDIDNPIYRLAFEKVKKTLLGNSLLPDANNGYTKPKNALLPETKKLVALLGTSDCEDLFGKSNWLSAKFNSNELKEVKKYFKEALDIQEITMEKFCPEITEDFLKKKSEEWMVELYEAFANLEDLYRNKRYSGDKAGILRNKPIIRLEDGAHISPENESGDIQVYLPTDRDSEFKTVKKTIANERNVSAFRFLKNLGIETPDGNSEIKEFIAPKYQGPRPEIKQDEYMKDFEKVFTIWSEENDQQKKTEIIDMFKDKNFVGSVNYENDFSLNKPIEVYYPTKPLKMWFMENTSDNICFLADCLRQEKRYKEFLDSMNICREPYIHGKGYYRMEKRFYVRGLDDFNPDFSIKGLQHSLDHINIERSFYIFDLALKYFKKLSGEIEESSRRDFSESGSHYNKESMHSHSGKMLFEKNWLYDISGDLITKPLVEISIEDLHEGYKKDHSNIQNLMFRLNMRSKEIKRIEKATGGKFLSAQEARKFEEFEKWLETENKNRESAWKPDVNALEVQINIDDSPHEMKPRASSLAQSTNKDADLSDTEAEEMHIRETQSSYDKKAIGDRGEKHAKSFLKGKHPNQEVICLNENGSVGRGCDFRVKENGLDIAYYEVKSKTDESPRLFQMTGAQWRLAQSLYEQGKGDMYKILLVSNTGKLEVRIKEISNPVELWKMGKLYATPVNIEL